MARRLAHPAGHSAAVAHLSEARLLEAQRQAVAGRVAWPSAAEPRESTGAAPAAPAAAGGRPACSGLASGRSEPAGSTPPTAEGSRQGRRGGGRRHLTTHDGASGPLGSDRKSPAEGPAFCSTHFTEQLLNSALASRFSRRLLARPFVDLLPGRVLRNCVDVFIAISTFARLACFLVCC